jgi:transcriptional regulator with XRE-family HTH domain
MHIITILRLYLGMSQTTLAKKVGITQPDLSEIETLPPYGYPAKYQRLAAYLGLSVDAIVKNDLTQIPLSFFENRPAPEYLPPPKKADYLLGRQGEDFIFQKEQERLSRIYPALSKLVIPHYKLKGHSPGYDILSFDDTGHPIYLEVKTSTIATGGFRFTNHELAVARKMLEPNEPYYICYITNWDKPEQAVEYLSFSKILQTHYISPRYYHCNPIPKPRVPEESGLAHFRRYRGVLQADMADALQIRPAEWSLYETLRRKPPIDIYAKTSELLDIPIDDLLRMYPTEPKQEGIRE